MFTSILYAFVSILYSVLMFFSAKRNLKLSVNLSFFIFLFGLFLWTTTLYIYFFIDTGSWLLFWGRLNYFSACPMYFGLVMFFYYFPQKNISLSKGLEWSVLILNIIFGYIVLFTPLIDENEVMTLDGPEITFGELYILFPIYLIVNLIFSFIFGFLKILKLEKGIEKTKLKYAFWGFLPTSLFLMLTNALLPIFDIYIIWEYSFIIMVPVALTSFYSIVKYRFLDIKFVITNTFKKLISLFITILVLFLIHSLFSVFNISINSLIFNPISLVIGIYFYLKLESFFSSHFFYGIFGATDVEYFRKVIDEFKASMSVTSVKFREVVEVSFCEKLKIDYARIILLSDENRKKYNRLIKYFSNNHLKENLVLVIQEIDFIKKQENISICLIKEFKKLGEICIPLFNPSKKLLGFFILGKKQFDDIYSKEEIQALEGIQNFLSLHLMVISYNSELKREVKSKTQELEYSNKKLKKLDKTKDNFLSMASHELRTPMTVIKGYTDFLLSKDFGELNKQQLEFVNYIQSSSNGLLSLVNDMLDLSKIESDRVEFEYEKVNLRKYFEKILKGFEVKSRQQNIEFRYSINSNLPKYIILDKQKVRLLLMNLIGNAFKFTKEKGNINVKVIQSANMLYIEVTDSGIGIAEDDLEKVFEKFGQVNNSLNKDYKGTGLGLSIVKKILDKMNGSIKLTSKVGKGSNFIVKFPILRKD